MNTAREARVHKAVLNVYALFGVSIVLSLVPLASAALFSMIFLAAALFWAYSLKNSAEAHSFGHIHSVFIIRTIWISGFFALITTVIAGAYMLAGLNHAPFASCASALADKGVQWIETAGMNEVYSVIEPCIHGFIENNKILLINAVLIAGGPVLIYMGYRFYKGLSRAVKGYTLPENKSWF